MLAEALAAGRRNADARALTADGQVIEQGGGDPTPLSNVWLRKTFKESNADATATWDAGAIPQTTREQVASHIRRAEASVTHPKQALEGAAAVADEDGMPYLERHGWIAMRSSRSRAVCASSRSSSDATRSGRSSVQSLPPISEEQLDLRRGARGGGSVSTTAVSYVTRLAGDHAGEPYRVSLDTPGADAPLALPRAIYLAYTRDRQLHYAGKVDRSNRGTVAQRIREHTRSSRRKRGAWRTLWIVPIDDTLTGAELLELERAVIRTFQPPGNVQHAKAA